MPSNFELFKERNVFDLLNSAFLFVKKNTELLIYISIIAGPLILITAYYSVQVSHFINSNLLGEFEASELMGLYAELIKLSDFKILLFLSILNSITISLIVYIYLIFIEDDKEMSLNLIWDAFLQYFFKASSSYLLMVLILFSGLILFVVPGIWLMAPMQFYIFIRIRENEALLDGVNRSINLMRGYWVESFFILITVYVIVSFIETIINYPANFMDISSDYYSIYSYFVAVIHGFLQFFLPLVSGLQYYNLRTKKGEIELNIDSE